MNLVYALLGGNLGDVPETFKQAVEQIKLQIGYCKRLSNIYVSEPWGFKSKDYFYNQALVIETDKSPEEILKHFLLIEKLLGRTRNNDYSEYVSRNIDIDILFFNDLIVNSKKLSIPHPLVHYRAFALLPLAEIAPTLMHPVLNKTIVQILSDCEDISYIRTIKQHTSKTVIR